MENITERSAKQSESHGRHVKIHDQPESLKPVIFKQGQNPFNTIEEPDSEKFVTFTGLESNLNEKKIFGGNVRPYLTQKEIILNEVLADIPEDDIRESTNKNEADKDVVKKYKDEKEKVGKDEKNEKDEDEDEEDEKDEDEDEDEDDENEEVEETVDEDEIEEETSGLNPKTEILTEKDPDEIIILPNDDLKKSLNKKNRNQPL